MPTRIHSSSCVSSIDPRRSISRSSLALIPHVVQVSLVQVDVMWSAAIAIRHFALVVALPYLALPFIGLATAQLMHASPLYPTALHTLTRTLRTGRMRRMIGNLPPSMVLIKNTKKINKTRELDSSKNYFFNHYKLVFYHSVPRTNSSTFYIF